MRRTKPFARNCARSLSSGRFRDQGKRKLPDLTRLHGQRWFSLEENPPIAYIFQHPLTGLSILGFQLLHDEPYGQLQVKSRMTSPVHSISSHVQSGCFGGTLRSKTHQSQRQPGLPRRSHDPIKICRYIG